ncbi:MAG TPA: signal peptidase II [candidate division Zixibacteria bacterium]|nr:signal peptidase II [candidate division Zixibacteria bacterium]
MSKKLFTRPFFCFSITFLVIFLDQLSKTIIHHSLFLGQSIPVLGEFFKITYILNPGGAFGTKLGGNNLYTILSLIAIILTFIFFFQTKKEQALVRTGLALILGGAVGNLIDRFRFGQVVDFLDFDFFNISIPEFKLGFINFLGFHLDRWPVFNIADSSVTCGAILIILQMFLTKKKPPETAVENVQPQI